jgi:hypothetical protein
VHDIARPVDTSGDCTSAVNTLRAVQPFGVGGRFGEMAARRGAGGLAVFRTGSAASSYRNVAVANPELPDEVLHAVRRPEPARLAVSRNDRR